MFGSSARRLPRHAARRWSYYPRHVKTRAIIGTGRDTAKAELRISPPYRYSGHPQRPPTHIAPVKGILVAILALQADHRTRDTFDRRAEERWRAAYIGIGESRRRKLPRTDYGEV